ncbi:uncharacterized protein (DUF302 family) [Nicoletella semolina]|uniref:Uncharacterized protein (DUF302 family) n=1 Tax=Nicoletella semolina TaxID=271160 RepID=A0A4R2NA73_9PAST|nr:DUF302 domain-containing protein [Nicoletella semolina]MDH2925418.1 hypothetical protein [Nicoletella semolina]TCP17898.1 uncharacterized protein (DUF302 family) [Nicoletella semolina]
MKKIFLLALSSVVCMACSNISNTNTVDSSAVERSASNLLTFNSNYNFTETKNKIITALQAKNMTIFSQIDHQAAAEKAGLNMQPASVIIFGTPKIGTPYMVKDPKFALELPLKVLVTEVDGKVQVVMKNTKSLLSDSQIEYSEIKDTLGKAELLIEKAIK